MNGEAENPVVLCGHESCRLKQGHPGGHDQCPTSAWAFLLDKDKDKLDKAGYATPRGGAKGAYQNHVVRSNRVIVPYEKLSVAPLADFADGYIVRLLPEQYFDGAKQPKAQFLGQAPEVQVGVNAFVLYRSHASFEALPPMDGWRPRSLLRNGQAVDTRRGNDVVDDGHYVQRLPTLGGKAKATVGQPQGIFAPEYADQKTNYLSRCVLAWLSVHTVSSPYTTTQAGHLKAILAAENLLDDERWEFRGVLRHGLTACPLCTRFILYAELHQMLALDDENALENAGVQIEGATRSTIVNLFHLEPLRYDRLDHKPGAIAWGHATCNTKLGQRRCFSVAELQGEGEKVGILRETGIETIGWLSPNWEMMRSSKGAVWIRICSDRGDEREDVGALPDSAAIPAACEEAN